MYLLETVEIFVKMIIDVAIVMILSNSFHYKNNRCHYYDYF